MTIRHTLSAVALSLALAACQAPAPGTPAPEASPTPTPSAAPVAVEEACEHLAKGPEAAVVAQKPENAGKVKVANDHKRYDVALEAGMTAVTFESAEAGEYVFALGQDVPLTLTGPTGQAVAIEKRETENLPCGEMKARVMADLEVGPYTLTFGPTEIKSVSVVIEKAGAGHDEEEHADEKQ